MTTQTATEDTPYATAALQWFDAGFSVLPLPARAKFPVPDHAPNGAGRKYTGHERADVTRREIRAWIGAGRGEGNIALVCRADMLGIDVDVYENKHGDDALAELEANFGPLPDTVRTSARGQGSPSGIRWFRIREGATFPGVLGPGIEVIQSHHRYGLVWPSINPANGKRYRTYDDRTGDVLETFTPDDCAELPEAWYDAEASGVGEGLDKSASVTDTEVAEWLDGDEANADAQCRAMRNTARAEVKALAAAESTGASRYELARDGSMALLRLAQEGHRGVRKALGALERAYAASVADESDRDAGEWDRMVRGAVAAVIDSVEDAHPKGRCPDRLEPDERGDDEGGEWSNADAEADLWPSPSQPVRVAERLCEEIWTWTPPEGDSEPVRTLTYWRGDFYQWVGVRWDRLPADGLRARLYEVLGRVEFAGAAADGSVLDWNPTKAKIANTLEALASVAYRDEFAEPDTGDAGEGVSAIPFANGMLRLRRADGKVRLVPHTPATFNLYSLPFDHDPDVAQPREWLRFLDSLELDDDVVALLQEWFGFVVSGDTSHSKLLYLFGATRAGKGVITRVLQQLVGRTNVASPNLAQFAEQFGMQSSIGKALITVNDARFRGVRTAEMVEKLLNYTGGDSMDIPRKNREPWNGVPTARVMIVSNDSPNVSGEQTSAFAKRIMPIKLHRSFFDAEDLDLETRLMGEMGAICMWALDGYDRLCEQRRFTQAGESIRLRNEMQAEMQPVTMFLTERCTVTGMGRDFVGKDRLYAAYRRWADDAGLYVASKIEFGRQLTGDPDGQVRSRQRRSPDGESRIWVWAGLSLHENIEWLGDE